MDITIKDLAYLISEITGFKGEISWDSSKPDGTFKKLLNTSKIKSIGWAPKISLEEGIRNIVKNFPSLYEKKINKVIKSFYERNKFKV